MPPRLREIVAQVRSSRRVALADVFGECMASDAVGARWEIWSRANALDPRMYSFNRLGQWFDCHHTTVMYGVKRHRSGKTPWTRNGRPRKEVVNGCVLQRI